MIREVIFCTFHVALPSHHYLDEGMKGQILKPLWIDKGRFDVHYWRILLTERESGAEVIHFSRSISAQGNKRYSLLNGRSEESVVSKK